METFDFPAAVALVVNVSIDETNNIIPWELDVQREEVTEKETVFLTLAPPSPVIVSDSALARVQP